MNLSICEKNILAKTVFGNMAVRASTTSTKEKELQKNMFERNFQINGTKDEISPPV